MSDAIVSSAIEHFGTSAYVINDSSEHHAFHEHDSESLQHRSLDASHSLSADTAQYTVEPATKFTHHADLKACAEVYSDGNRVDAADQHAVIQDGVQEARVKELRSCLTRAVSASKRNGSRRVRFPEDGMMVSGAMPPFDPWNMAHVSSPEELVNSYRLACEAQSIRANPYVEEQLKSVALQHVADRHSGLCLKNVKLDTRHCEALEQVLRRVRFVLLDLENTQLDDEAACMLFDMVEFYESAVRLSLANNARLTLRGWLACARMLKMTRSLEFLDLRHCVFNENTITVLARALKFVEHLTVLHLEHAAVSGRVLATLVAALRINESVREVYLSDSRLMPSDGVHLAALLKYNRTVQLLDLRNNSLQDVGLMHLCEGISEQSSESGLRTLILWNNQITHYSMAAFARAIALSKCLESVNVGSNNVTNEGVHQLKEGLIKNKTLLHFGLKAAKIGCEGAVALAEYIAECPQLQRIDLRGNDIRTGGLMALSLALRVNRTIQQIDLDREPKREPGVDDYAGTQKRLLNTIGELTERNVQVVKLKEEVKQQLLELQAESLKLSAEKAATEQHSAENDAAPSEHADIGVGEDKTTVANDAVCGVSAADDADCEAQSGSKPSASGDDDEEPGPDEQTVVLAEQITGSEMSKATLKRRKFVDDDVACSQGDSQRLSAPAILIGRQLSPRNSLVPSANPPAAAPVEAQVAPPPVECTSVPLSPTVTVVRNRFSVSLVSPEELGVSRTRLREIAAAAKSQRTASVCEDDALQTDVELLRVTDAPVVSSSRTRSVSACVDSS